jgi:hypothetical protein
MGYPFPLVNTLKRAYALGYRCRVDFFPEPAAAAGLNLSP